MTRHVKEVLRLAYAPRFYARRCDIAYLQAYHLERILRMGDVVFTVEEHLPPGVVMFAPTGKNAQILRIYGQAKQATA